MYGLALGLAGFEPSNNYVRQALAILRRKASSPAGIFTPGLGYLQVPGNLLTWSKDGSNAAWTKTRVTTSAGAGYGGLPSTLITWDGTLSTGYEFQPHAATSGQPYTIASVWRPGSTSVVTLKSFTPSADAIFTLSGSGVVGAIAGLTSQSSIIALSDGAYLMAATFVANATGTNNVTPGIVSGSADFIGGAVFSGTYTASQIAAMGGIPLTTTTASTAVYTDAHAYIAGSNGVTVAGLLSNNFDLSTGGSLCAVDGSAGLVLDGMCSQIVPAVGDIGVVSGCDNTLSGVSSTGFTTTAGANNARVYVNFETQIGKSYRIQGLMATAGAAGVIVYSRSGSNGGGATINNSAPILSGVGFSLEFTATGTASCFLFVTAVVAQSFSVSNMALFAGGIHATQPTTLSKPSVRRGLLNLLTYSNDLTNAVWIAQFTATKAAGILTFAATGDNILHLTSVASGPITSAYILSGSGVISLSGFNPTNGIFGVTPVTLTATPTLYVCNLPATAVNTQLNIGRLFGSDTATTVNVGGVGLFQGTLTAQQILAEGGIPVTTTAAASNPSAGRYWLGFDGSNDSLTLGSVPFQMADDHMVVFAARFDLIALDRPVFTARSGTALIRIGCSAGVVDAYWRDDATTSSRILAGTLTAGTTVVIAARKVGNTKQVYLNGVLLGTETTELGTSTITGAAIGVDPVSSVYFSGAIYSILPLKGTFTDAELLTEMRYAGQIAGVTF